MSDRRRAIPSVEKLLNSSAFAALLRENPRTRIVSMLRQIQEEQRAGSGSAETDDESYAAQVRLRIESLEQGSLSAVINATGVVLHTNLGRAPLAQEAIQAMMDVAAGYSNLEYDLEHGTRGSRYDHCRRLLCELTGAEDALVVNNNAAALVLALNTVAADREAIVSRGELVEIGGSFRVPEIMARSGARMREVGATNRVHASDYQAALNEATAAILKVHPSNFRITGFTSEASLTELAALARGCNVPLLFDLGSGLLIDLQPFGLPEEPRPEQALEAGADLVTISGDKLLGGPQAGIVLGRAEIIARMKRNPLCRALRVDKLTLAALEATLRLYLQPARALARIPTLRMLTTPAETILQRAGRIADQLRSHGIECEAVPTRALVGGGAFPDSELASGGIQIRVPDPNALDARLRAGKPALVSRITHEHVVLDLRTVDPDQDDVLLKCVVDASR